MSNTVVKSILISVTLPAFVVGWKTFKHGHLPEVSELVIDLVLFLTICLAFGWLMARWSETNRRGSESADPSHGGGRGAAGSNEPAAYMALFCAVTVTVLDLRVGGVPADITAWLVGKLVGVAVGSVLFYFWMRAHLRSRAEANKN